MTISYIEALVGIRSLGLGLHIAICTVGISDDPRHAAFAKEWDAGASRAGNWPTPS